MASNRWRAFFWLALGACGSTRCGGRVQDFDSESHFLCEKDSDCGVSELCVGNHCVASVPSPISSSEVAPRDGGVSSRERAPSTPPARDAGPPPSAVDSGSLPEGLAPIVGVAGDGNGGFLLVRVDPGTGAELSSIGLSRFAGIEPGNSAFDPATSRLITLAELTESNDMRLVSLDARTGSIIDAPVVGPDLGWPELVGSGELVGMISTSSAGTFFFGTLDPGTGSFDALSSFSAARGLEDGMSTVDATRNLYYAVTSEDDPPKTHLLAFDVATGALVRDTPTDRAIFDPVVIPNGDMYAFDVALDSTAVLAVDPESGATRTVAVFPSTGAYQGGTALDGDAGILYQTYTATDSGGSDLAAVDLASGRVRSVPLAHLPDVLAVCTACRAPVTD